jgi:hypothetical protein
VVCLNFHVPSPGTEAQSTDLPVSP